jgi:Outer membrane protein beta-barrel domain
MTKVRIVFITVLFAAAAALPARAQQRAAPSLTGGFEIGYNFSHLSPEQPGQDVSTLPGLFIGGYMLFPAWTAVGIQAEVVYEQKGSNLSSTQDVKVDYIEVPVLAKLTPFKSVYLLGGVGFAFPVSAKYSAVGQADTDVKSTTTSPDVSLIIAGGVPIHRVDLELRYDGGFRTISSATAAPVERNRSWTVVGRFPL